MAVVAFVATAQEYWERPEVFEVNKLPARATLTPYATLEEALAREDSSWVQDISGAWKFHWSGDPQRRPFVFESPSFDVSKWETIDVPCCVEMRADAAAARIDWITLFASATTFSVLRRCSDSSFFSLENHCIV